MENKENEQKTIIGKNGNILKPFPKGVSGNPTGNPKGYKSLKTLAREMGVKKIKWKDLNGNKKNIPAVQAMLYTLLANAIKGDTRAARIFSDIHQDKKLQLTDAEGAPIIVQIVDDITAD